MLSCKSIGSRLFNVCTRRNFSKLSRPMSAKLSYQSLSDLEDATKKTNQFDFNDFQMYASGVLQRMNFKESDYTPEQSKELMQKLMQQYFQYSSDLVFNNLLLADISRTIALEYPTKSGFPEFLSTLNFQNGLEPAFREFLETGDLQVLVNNNLVSAASPLAFRIKIFTPEFVQQINALVRDARLWVDKEPFLFKDGSALTKENVFGEDFKQDGQIILEDFGLKAATETYMIKVLNAFGQDAYKQAFDVKNVCGLLKDRIGVEVNAEEVISKFGSPMFNIDTVKSTYLTHRFSTGRKFQAEQNGGVVAPEAAAMHHIDVALPVEGVINFAVCMDANGHSLLVPNYEEMMKQQQANPDATVQKSVWVVPLTPGEGLLYPDSMEASSRVMEAIGGVEDTTNNSLVFSAKSNVMNSFWLEQTKAHVDAQHKKKVAEIKAEAAAKAEKSAK